VVFLVISEIYIGNGGDVLESSNRHYSNNQKD
jgi:hypothetical protein